MRALLCVLAIGCHGDPAPESAPPPKPETTLGLALPEVAGAGYAPGELAAPVLAITAKAIVVEGKAIVPVANGKVPAAEKEGGELGLKIEKLVAVLGQLPRAPALTVAVDRSTPYGLFIEGLYSAKQKAAGWKDFTFVARAGDKLVTLPIRLPDKSVMAVGSGELADPDEDALEVRRVVVGGGPPDDAIVKRIEDAYLADIAACANSEQRGLIRMRFALDAAGAVTGTRIKAPDDAITACLEPRVKRWAFGKGGRATSRVAFAVRASDPRIVVVPFAPQLFVTITKDKLLVWSITGEEGTLRDPKATLAPTDSAKLSAVLAEIVQRRWPYGVRPPDASRIVVMGEYGTPMQTLARVFGAVRATPDGKPLFPDITLSAGFE
jgi:hypothetical protein